MAGPSKRFEAFHRPGGPPSRLIDRVKTTLREHLPYFLFKTAHNQFFEKKHPMTPYYRKAAEVLSKNHRAKWSSFSWKIR